MTTPASATKVSPGAARTAQIEGILLADEVMKTQIGPKDAPVLRRDGTATIHFHRLSVAVAERMMADGKEPMQTPKAEVLNIARLVLDEQAEAAAMGEAAPAPAVAAPAAAAPAPAVAAPAAPTPPAAAPVAPKAKKPKKVAAATTEAPAAAAAAADATETPAPAAEPAVAAPAAAAAPDTRKLDVHLSIYSLIISATELSERDTRPGASERRAALVAAGKGYYALIG